MTTSATTHSASVSAGSLPARVIERVRLWHERRRWVRELTESEAYGRLDNILSDVGLTRSELSFLRDGPADAGRQFETFAEMRGVDVEQLPPDVLRAAIHACAHCDCRVPCKRWLRTGVWHYDGDSRCPNAALLQQ